MTVRRCGLRVVPGDRYVDASSSGERMSSWAVRLTLAGWSMVPMKGGSSTRPVPRADGPFMGHFGTNEVQKRAARRHP